MAKKKMKNVYYIVAAVIIVILIAVFMLRKPAEEVPEEVVPEEVVEEEAEEIPEPEVPTEYIGTILSDAVCVDNEIQATISNTGETTETIGDKIIVQVNSLVVRAPTCDEMTLEPGESTRCSDMSGPFPVRAGKQNLVFDFGRGALGQLLKLGIKYYEIDAIFISHTHADHCSELSSFLHIALAEPPIGKFRKKDI